MREIAADELGETFDVGTELLRESASKCGVEGCARANRSVGALHADAKVSAQSAG